MITAVPDTVRRRLALALDTDDLVAATRLARDVAPWFGVAKVGLELFTAAGPEAVGAMRELGYEVFLDLKLHDIPTTVGKAARVVGALGATYLTLHTSGGDAMVRAGVEGLAEGADAVGLGPAIALGVTVLTSDADATGHELRHRIGVAVEAGCQGLVCSALDVHEAHLLAPRLVTVVPGIRPSGVAHHDQARVATPGDAIRAGAGVLVIGRAVTGSLDRAAAAAAVAAEVEAAIA
jgi:orotidine-5'-phosphate decarboxylase